jgi:hypothetical protein
MMDRRTKIIYINGKLDGNIQALRAAMEAWDSGEAVAAIGGCMNARHNEMTIRDIPPSTPPSPPLGGIAPPTPAINQRQRRRITFQPSQRLKPKEKTTMETTLETDMPMTPGEAIRRRCVDCAADGYHAVRGCEIGNCQLHRFRMGAGTGRPSVKTIRAYCLWCSGDSAENTKHCPDKSCALWPFRLGHNPNVKPTLSDEERTRRAELLNRSLGRDCVSSSNFNDKGLTHVGVGVEW